MNESSPIFIGGIGGSGTRVICQILKDAGLYMGSNLNEKNDAVDFYNFYLKWANVFLKERIRMNDKTIEQMKEDYHSSLKNHLKMLPDKNSNWGAKNPRSIIFLPFLFSQFPKMHFLHIIRDGRDMIFSKNLNLLNLSGTILLNKQNLDKFDNLSIWSMVNLNTKIFCEQKLKDNYLVIKFEELCSNPKGIIEKIFNFTGVLDYDLSEIEQKIIAPKTIGRWKEHKEIVLDKMTLLHTTALNCFGYD